MNKNILIIGAGLSGIYLAYLLKKEGFTIKLLEANDRIGGRIYTKNIHNTKVELGATWLWKYNLELLKLCQDLDIALFEQNMRGDALFESISNNSPQRFQIPINQEISYRMVGGTTVILNKLTENITDKELILNQKVVEIFEKSDGVNIITKTLKFSADFVISTIPPQLLINTIQFSPRLDEKLIQVANNTHTWMKDSIKFSIIYNTPFWKEKGLSGVGFSNVGPFTEIYDHSDFENKHFALMGFINGNLANETKSFRENKIRIQLNKFFGDEGINYLSYEEKIWPQENLLNYKNKHFISPHFNNGHSIYQESFLNGKLIIGGSETSTSYGGYMEGAIYRGNQIVSQLKDNL